MGLVSSPHQRLSKARDHLKKFGLLLEHDQALTSVTALIAGETVMGSWWSHPLCHEMYEACEELADASGLIRCKLVKGKLTFVERGLWPDLVAVAISREPWQTRKLSPAARRLLERVLRAPQLRADELSPKPARLSDLLRQLERQLLIYAEDLHTERGSHTKILEGWEHWAKRMKIERTRNLGDAKARIEQAARRLSIDGGLPKLPWA